jgi:hypothetical protein
VLADRKKRATDMQECAETSAKENRKSKLVESFNKCLLEFKQGDETKEDLFERMQKTFEGIYEEDVTITQGELTETFDVKLFGFNSCAVSASTRDVIVTALTKLHRSQAQGPRKKKRRKPIVTKIGQSGPTAGIKQHRHRMKEVLEERINKEKKESKELKDSRDLIEAFKTDVETNKDGYWIVGKKMTGKKRERMAKLFEVYKSGYNAKQQTDKLTELGLTKEKVDTRLTELEGIAGERTISFVATAVAARSETEDLLAHTQQYSDNDDSEDDVEP